MHVALFFNLGKNYVKLLKINIKKEKQKRQVKSLYLVINLL